MSASEQANDDAERVSEKEQDPRSGAEPHDGVHAEPHDGAHEVPLFLRDGSDGPKGNAQDEKDEVGE